METDNCYGKSSINILPNFLGSILELFTSTSNIIILMICGAQFRNELIDILHLRKIFPKIQRQQQLHQQQQQQQQYRLNQNKGNRKRSKKNSTYRMTLSLPSSQNGVGKTNLSNDPSMDSLLVSCQTKDDISFTETEQPSDEIYQYPVKSTTV
jgi:hypothetical protein